MSKKRLLIIFVTLLIVCMVGTFVAMAASIELTVMVPNPPGDARTEWYQRQADLFHERHPHVRIAIEPHSGGRGDFPDRVNVMMAGGVGPDLVLGHIRDTLIGGWLMEGFLVDLEPFIEADAFDLSDFPPSLIDPWRYEGKLVAFPLGPDTAPIYYDVDLMEEAGLADPVSVWKQGQWHWDTFLHYARNLTSDVSGDGQVDMYGYGIGWSWILGWPTFLYSEGGSIISADGMSSTIYTTEAARGFSRLAEVFLDYQVARTGQINRPDVAMATTCLHIGPQTAALGRNIGIVPHPSPRPGADPVHSAITLSMHVMGSTEHPEIAWEFIKQMVEYESLVEFAAMSGRIGSRISAFEDWIELYSEYATDADMFALALAQSTSALPLRPEAEEIRVLITNGLGPVIRGETAVESALQDMERLINAILQ